MTGTESASLPRKLGLLDSTSIVVGIVIGSGIFVLPNLIARSLPSRTAIFAVWIISGVLSFFGALAYAELGAMLPLDTGGDYVYLRVAYGPLWAFLCAWTLMLAVLAGGSAWLAVTFSIYAGYFVSLTPAAGKMVSIALLAILSAVNYVGVRESARVQVTFTVGNRGADTADRGGIWLADRQPVAHLRVRFRWPISVSRWRRA